MKRCSVHKLPNQTASPIIRDGKCIQCFTAHQSRVVVPVTDFNMYRERAAKQRVLLDQLKREGAK